MFFLIREFFKSFLISPKIKIGFVLDVIPIPYDMIMASTRLRVYDVINNFRKDPKYSLELYRPWKKYNIVIFQKKFDNKAYRLAQKLKKKGTKIALDINVNYYDITALNKGETFKKKQILDFTEIADGIITSTEYLRDYIKKLFPEKNIVYIPENITNNFFLSKKITKKDNRNLKLMYVGYAIKAKEILNIKRVLRSLRNSYNFSIVLICEKNPRISIDEIKIEFIKYQQNKIPQQMLEGDIFIAPRDLNNPYNLGHSFTKVGYPMSIGLPVIANRIPSYGDSLAILCNNEEDWENNLKKLLENRTLRQDLGERGIRYCKNNFSPSTVKSKHEDFLKKLYSEQSVKIESIKIVINTNYDSAGTKVCVDDLTPRLKKAGYFVARNDWNNYSQYDMALFMAPDSQVQIAKKKNPQIITGIMDPKITTPKTTSRRNKREMACADFLLVSSIEQRDFFYKYNKNIIIYYMFPNIRSAEKIHTNKDKIIIGYHGNKVHLNCFYPKITKALEEIASEFPIELWVMYNIKKLDKWRHGIPKNVKTKHIQWSEENYHKYLAEVDIGIVNDEIPIKEELGKITTRHFEGEYLFFNIHNYHRSDYLTRYKCSSNPGRIYVFSQLGIPVISDFTPSACQIIRDGESGLLVHSAEGWYEAMETLITSPNLRNQMSSNLRNYINNTVSIDKNFENLLLFLRKIIKKNVKELKS